MTALLALPGERDRIALETWLSFGTWVQPGNDLLQQLQERLARVVGADADNPVTGLPANYRITIFSLRPLSARRGGCP